MQRLAFLSALLAPMAAACVTDGLDDGTEPTPASAAATIHAGNAEAAARAILGVRDDLVLERVHHSITGEHVRFRRLAPDGTTIVGGGVVVNLRGHGPAFTPSRLNRPAPRAVEVVGSRSVGLSGAGVRAIAAVAVRPDSGKAPTLQSIEAAALPIAGDPSRVTAGFHARVSTESPAHLWDVWVDGGGEATVRKDLLWRADGTGLVFRPNPVTSTGNVALTDNNDATSTALDNARISATIPRLDGTGFLRGSAADAHPLNTARTQSGTLTFNFNRAALAFEEVNAYFHVDAAQNYLQTLGFTDANNRVVESIVDALSDDNSNYNPGDKKLRFGTGGVDDAEDGDVVIHEYGHATQDDIVPGWGDGDEGSMGEGFGDLLAATTPTGADVLVSRACVAPWDATSYSGTNPPCLRRTDGTKHFPENADGEVHDDGEIWTGAIWPLLEEIGTDEGMRLVVESFFSMSTNESFGDWATYLLEADASLGGTHEVAIKRALWDRGLYREPAPAGTFSGDVTTAEIDESAGPLGNNDDDSLTVHQDGASAIRLHFSAFSMQQSGSCFENHCDNVYLFNADGDLYQTLGGNLGAFNSVIVPGDTVVVRWVTNGSGSSTGFAIDSIEFTGGGGGPPDAGIPDAAPGEPDAGPEPGEPDAAPTSPDAAPTGPDAATGGDDDDDDDDDDDGGCGCRLGGESGRGAGATFLLGSLATLALVRRRRPVTRR
jgi:fungalysin metallopeptidase (M36)